MDQSLQGHLAQIIEGFGATVAVVTHQWFH
jgi:hypothetical protein